jgi:hypothetical protein
MRNFSILRRISIDQEGIKLNLQSGIALVGLPARHEDVSDDRDET